jgi:hypothetical protein
MRLSLTLSLMGDASGLVPFFLAVMKLYWAGGAIAAIDGVRDPGLGAVAGRVDCVPPTVCKATRPSAGYVPA